MVVSSYRLLSRTDWIIGGLKQPPRLRHKGRGQFSLWRSHPSFVKEGNPRTLPVFLNLDSSAFAKEGNPLSLNHLLSNKPSFIRRFNAAQFGCGFRRVITSLYVCGKINRARSPRPGRLLKSTLPPWRSPQIGDRFGDNLLLRHVVSHPLENMVAMVDTIGGGVCERHPKIKLAFLECYCGWVSFLLHRMDNAMEKGRFPTAGKLQPSEYFNRQCWISTEHEKELPMIIDLIGDDKIVFSTDYPHGDSDFPHAVDIRR